jgi:DNA-binding response OmpR family regulator/MinD-like ATPase involved in chromosome partitioning or flagellar assembly
VAKRVLIVDDDPGQRLLATSVCQLQGYVVHEAATGAEGLESALHDEPDAILLDWELPDIAGPDLCREMRSRGVTCPILMLTGRAAKADVVMGLEVGADDYLVKPVDNKELAARLGAQMRRAGIVHEPPTRELAAFLDLLQSAAIFFAVPTTTLRKLAAEARAVKVKKGDVALRQGAHNAQLFIVRGGLFRVEVESQPGSTLPVTVLGRGDFFGADSLFSGEPSLASVRAVADSEMVVLERRDLHGALPPASQQLNDLRNVANQRTAKLRGLADRGPTETPRGLARTVAVYSPKGGSGKSTIAVNLAATLARKAPGQVLLLDLALPYNDCALLTQLTPTTCLARFAEAGEEFGELLSSAVLSHPESSLNVLSAAIRPEEADLISPQLVTRALEVIKLEFQYVVVDLGIALSESALTVLEQSDDVLLVLTPEISTLKAFTQLQKILQDILHLAEGQIHVVINHRTPHSTMNTQEVESVVNHRVAAEIRYQGARLEQSALSGKIPAYDEPNSQIGQAMAVIVRRLER